MEKVDELYPAGVVSTLHGLRGDIVARSEDQVEPLLLAGVLCLFRDNTCLGSFRVLRSSAHKGGALMQLEGVSGRDQAQQLQGAEIRLPRAAFPPLGKGRHYWFELEGIRVLDRRTGDIGKLVGRILTPAHPLYVVEGPGGEFMIPAVPQMILEPLGDDGCMHVDLPEGLISINNEL